MKTIAYQGVSGAFSHLTALNVWGRENHFRGVNTFREVFELVEGAEADYALIPIENSLIGSIYENYDLLSLYDMQIVGEYFTPIKHCLLGLAPLEKIKKIISHPKALEQCASFFRRHPGIEAVVYSDTAAAAEKVGTRRDPTEAAIASEAAARLYGLDIVQKGIEDDPKNYTRFVAVTKKHTPHAPFDKGSLLVHLKHTPGSLARMLAPFAHLAMNVTKVESRPLRGTPFEYLFYVDFECGGREQQEIDALLQALKHVVHTLKIVGFYKRGVL